MVLFDNDAFLTELMKLFIKTKEAGSLFVTCKRYEPKSSDKDKKGKKAQKNGFCFRR